MLWHNTLWGFMLIDTIQPSSLVTNAIPPISSKPNTSLMVWPFQQFPILQRIFKLSAPTFFNLFNAA